MSLLTDSETFKSKFHKAFSDAMKAKLAMPIPTSQFRPTTKSHEEIFCDTHFGGMKLSDVIAIVKSHSPEYFV